MTDKKYTNTGSRSTEFKTNPETAWKYAVIGPAKLGIRVKAKAKAMKISVRALILGLLQRWVNGDIEHPKPGRLACECRTPDPRGGICQNCEGTVARDA